MNAKDINKNYDLLSLVQRDTKLKQSGNYFIAPCPFCGGEDRFNLKKTSNGQIWLCRHCTNARYKSAIDYVMQREGIEFKEALKMMGGEVAFSPSSFFQEQIQAKPELSEIFLPDADWQKQRWHEVTMAMDALLKSEEAIEYLRARALDRSMWFCYRLGFAIVYKRPAIVIPWFDETETITAVKYRFIDDLAKKDKGRRYMMATGSKQILYGLHAASQRKTLILVEGEFNAMSITQADAHYLVHIDSLSFGGETTIREDILQAITGDYQRLVIWADDPEIANNIWLSLGKASKAICSPEIDGEKQDANTMLKNSILADFLHETAKDIN